MAGFDWDAELSAEQRDAMIEKLAEQVIRRRLAVPVILMLEMHKPLAFLAGQSLILGSGFLAPIFGPQNVQQAAKLLESRDNIERLIREIESRQTETGHTESRRTETEPADVRGL